MKMRILSIAMILALLLCGCGSQEDVSGTITPATETQTALPSTEAATEATTEPAQEENPVTLGSLEGGTYTNAYIGFGFTLDENWTIYPADQLQDLPENVEAMFEGTELEGNAVTQIMDVMAENVTDLTTMNVLYQKLSMQERLVYLTMDEVEILDTMLNEYYDALVASYANAGIIVERMEKKEVTFLGQDRTALYTVASVEGVAYYILQLYDFHLGQYSVTTTVASYVEDNTESLLELFYEVE